MSFSKEAAVGFFVMLGLVCVAYLTVKLGRMEVFHSEGYVLTASFNSVSGLRPGAEVEIAGVRVGRVKSIRLDDKQPRAVVELQLGDNVHLTDDVIASVKTSGLIGDKYISLEPGGSGEPLKNGDEITDTESAVPGRPGQAPLRGVCPGWAVGRRHSPASGRCPLLCTRLLRVGLCGFRDRRVLAEDQRLADHLPASVHRPGPGRPENGRLATKANRC